LLDDIIKVFNGSNPDEQSKDGLILVISTGLSIFSIKVKRKKLIWGRLRSTNLMVNSCG